MSKKIFYKISPETFSIRDLNGKVGRLIYGVDAEDGKSGYEMLVFVDAETDERFVLVGRYLESSEESKSNNTGT